MKLVKLVECLPIDVYFTVTGGAIAPLVDAARDKVVMCQHEQAAVMAAEGYYRASGKLAGVLVTSGPGIQNTLNGVCGCWYDSIPCLVISGQVNTNESLDSIQAKPRQVGFQEMPVVDMFKHCTKYCENIKDAADVYHVFQAALDCMLTGRKGPAVIDFPVNIQMSDFDIHDFSVPKEPMYPPIDRIDFSEFKRPLVVLGNGARECKDEFLRWVSVPFVCSWAAKDIGRNHRLCIGCHGVYGNREANFAIQNADLLVILGSRFDTRQSGGVLSTCSKHSKRVMVDIDEHEIDKLNERGFTIHHKFVNTVVNFIQSHHLSSENWVKLHVQETYTGNVYSILKQFEIPNEAIVIPDCGGNLVWSMQCLSPSRIFTNLGNSSMGYSLPAAIGASLACPNVPVVCIIGDGGLQMNVQELYTLKRLNLPVTVVVLNNSGYGIIRQFQDTYLDKRHVGVDMHLDFRKIASAYDIRNSDCLHVSRDGPFLCDIQVDPDQRIIPKVNFGNSLENMTPYNQTVIDNMFVPANEYISTSSWRK